MKIINTKKFLDPLIGEEQVDILADSNPLFKKLYGDVKKISSYLETIGNFATDYHIQIIYELLQNADDANNDRGDKNGQICFFFDENYFLVINNGKPFSQNDLKSFLSEGAGKGDRGEQNVKGKYGKGSKLLYNLLVDKSDNATEKQKKKDLAKKLRGPILFTWTNAGQLESLRNWEDDSIETTQDDYYPQLMKIIKAHYPAFPDEKSIKGGNLFPRNEIKELAQFVNANKKYLDFSFFDRGSLIFIKLGKGQAGKLREIEKDNTFTLQNFLAVSKNISHIYINDQKIKKSDFLSIEKGNDRILFPSINCKVPTDDIVNFYDLLPITNEKHGLKFIIDSSEFEKTDNRQSINWEGKPLETIKKRIEAVFDDNKENFQVKLSLYNAIIESCTKESSNSNVREFHNSLFQGITRYAPIYTGSFFPIKSVVHKNFDIDIPIERIAYAWLHPDIKKYNEIDIESWSLSDTLSKLEEKECLDPWLNELFEGSTPSVTYTQLIKKVIEDKSENWKKIKIFRMSDKKFYSYTEIKEIKEYFWFNTDSKDIRIVLNERNDVLYNDASLLEFEFPELAIEEKIDGYIDFFNKYSDSIKPNHLPLLVTFLCDNGNDLLCEKIRTDLIVFKNEMDEYKPLSELINFEKIKCSKLISFAQIKAEFNFPALSEFYLKKEQLWQEVLKNWEEVKGHIGVLSTAEEQSDLSTAEKQSDLSTAEKQSDFYDSLRSVYECRKKQPSEKPKDIFLNRKGEFITSDDLFFSYELFKNDGIAYREIENVFSARGDLLNYLPFPETIADLDHLPSPNTSVDFFKKYLNDTDFELDLKTLNHFIFIVQNIGANFFDHFCIINKKEEWYYLRAHEKELIQYQSEDTELNDLLSKSDIYYLLPESINKHDEKISTDQSLLLGLINKYKEKKGYEKLINTVIASDKTKKKLYLNGLTCMEISSDKDYNNDSFQYKVIKLALENQIEDIRLRNKIIIDGKESTHYQYKDSLDVSVKENSIPFSLSKLLPKYKGVSDIIDKVKAKFPFDGIDKLFPLKEMEINDVLTKLPPFLRNPDQTCFKIVSKLSGENAGKIKQYKAEKDKRVLLQRLFEKLGRAEINYNDAYTFDDFDPKKKISTKSDEEGFLLDVERVPSWVKEWHEGEKEKKTYLKKCGLESKTEIIKFRQNFASSQIKPSKQLVSDDFFYENTCAYIKSKSLNGLALQNIGKLLNKHKSVKNKLSCHQILISSKGYSFEKTEKTYPSYFISEYESEGKIKEFIKDHLPDELIIDNKYAKIDTDVLKEYYEEIEIKKAPQKGFDKDRMEVDWKYYQDWKTKGNLNYFYEIFLIPQKIKITKQWNETEIETIEKDFFSIIEEKKQQTSKKKNRIFLFRDTFSEENFLDELGKILAEIKLEEKDFIKLQQEFIHSKKEDIKFIEKQGGAGEIERLLSESRKKILVADDEALIKKDDKEKINKIKKTLSDDLLELLLENLDKVKEYLQNIDEADPDLPINLITGYVGELVFEWYLKKTGLKYEYVAKITPEYDFISEDKNNVVDVKSTKQSLKEASNSLPFYVKESQYKYIKSKENDKAYNIARLSMKDIQLNDLIVKYEKNDLTDSLKEEIKKEVTRILDKDADSKNKIKEALIIFTIEHSNLDFK